MSIKNLFGKSFQSFQSASVDLESTSYADAVVEERLTYLPPIDFASASNFVKYGSAELYYSNSIKRIYNEFPYDGSKTEKIKFHQSSSYLDRWMYTTKYPKTTGHVTLGTTGYQGGKDAEGYGKTTTNEFIRVWGGIHTASAGMVGVPLRETFHKSGKYDESLNRTQNWSINPTSGSTVEFWLKIPDFDMSKSNHMVILDVWNGVDPYASSNSYSRFQIKLEKTVANQNRFKLTYFNDNNGFPGSFISEILSDSDIAQWHHYAFTVSEGSAANLYQMDFYIDGQSHKSSELNAGAVIPAFQGLLNGYIGALQATNTHASTTVNAVGSGKLSGSLDEFRFWKKARTGRQIGLNWFRQIGGGMNTDNDVQDLGVYFKFNEGITGNNNTDSVVLDYSGRVANGTWIGYSNTTNSRLTTSAIELSNSNLTESKDPIIYSTHPDVVALEAEMTTSGSDYDAEYQGSFYNTFPNWITEEDGDNGLNLKNISQILASYFDTLHAQITAMSNLKNKNYVLDTYKPIPFAKELLSEKGFIVKDLFIDSKIYELYDQVNFDAINFEKNLSDIRNLIYINIYNNLEAIYKSKGTEKSIRNLIRCFGIDDEIIKLNMYTDGGLHYFSDKSKDTSVKKKYINFNDTSYYDATIYQTSSVNNVFTFISGSTSSNNGSNNAFTLEADIVVPYKKEVEDEGYYSNTFISSSIFGFRQAIDTDVTDYTWSTGSANLSVWLVKNSLTSKDAHFVVKNQEESIHLISDTFEEIYDNNHWNLALRIKPSTYPYAGNVVGNPATPTDYVVEFYAVNHNFDIVENEVLLSATINNYSGSAFLSNAKRVYAGARLQNFTGSVLENSDIELGAVRGWFDYVGNDIIRQHNKDPSNFGNLKSYGESNMFTIENKQIPSQDLMILNWDFDTVTGSDGSGEFLVDDLTSGSTDNIYGWIDNVIRRENKGEGYRFNRGPTSSGFLKNNYLYALKKELPEISFSNDNVFIKGDRQKYFIKDEDVSDNFYMVEKSINQVVSEEMLKMFSSIHEFSNLIGRPVDLYRPNYKRLDAVRAHFFENVESDVDREKFIKYYKWIDQAVSEMILQLVPASVNFGDGVTDVIDSHMLERNKLQRRIGLVKTIESTEGAATGINELLYNWKFGHAPQDLYVYPSNKYLNIGKNTGGGVNKCLDTAASISPRLGSSNTDYCFYGWFYVPNPSVATPTMLSFRKGLTPAVNINIDPENSRIKVILYDDSSKIKTWYFPTEVDISSKWFHLIFMNDRSEGSSDAAIKLWVNGQPKTASSTVPGSGWGSTTIREVEDFRVLSLPSSQVDYAIDEAGFIRGTITNDQVQEIYNGGNYFDILEYSNLGSVVAHYRFGDLPGDSAADHQQIKDLMGNYDLDVFNDPGGSEGDLSIEEHVGFLRGTGFISEGDNNCLWRKERQKRTDIPDREKIREVLETQVNREKGTKLATTDLTVYEGSTYAVRKLTKPYRLTIDFANTIHGGINYNKQKDRDFFKSTITPHGAKGASGAPKNVFGIGLGIGSGILEKQKCDDDTDPLRKVYYDATIYAGKFIGSTAGDPLSDIESFSNILKASKYWPANIKSGSLTTGYNSITQTFDTGSSIVNLHSDTTDLSNEIPMQGPFTQTHVGGRQNRHIPVNRFNADLSTPNNLDGQYTRPEAWRLLSGDSESGDGAIGFVGPDYGGPYPDKTRQMAIYYREGRTKSVVNIRNIQSSTNSYVQGNYRMPYDFLSSFGSQRGYLRETTSSLLPTWAYSRAQTLNSTTHYMTLVGQSPLPFGNFFGQQHYSFGQITNNRQPIESQTLITSAIQNAYVQIDLGFVAGGTFPQLHNFVFVITSADGTSKTYKFKNGGAFSSGDLDGTNVVIQISSLNGHTIITEIRTAVEGSSGHNGKVSIVRLTSSTASARIHVVEQAQAGTSGNSLTVSRSSGPIPAWNMPPSNAVSVTANNGVDEASTTLLGLDTVREIPNPLSQSSKNFITTRFSAPGGPEINSTGYLDIATQQFSVHNSINYRNLTVRGSGSGESGTIRVSSHALRREGLRTLLSRHCGKFGIDSVHGSISADNYDAEASFYKQHRNALVTPRITNEGSLRNALRSAATTTDFAYISNTSSIGYSSTDRGPLSFSFWINLDNASSGDQTLFAGRDHSSRVVVDIKIDYSGTGKLKFTVLSVDPAGAVGVNSWLSVLTSSDLFGVDIWKFVVLSWDGSFFSDPVIYINGSTIEMVRDDNNPGDRLIIDEIYLFDDKTASPTMELQGSLANFAIWNCELDPKQALDLYEQDGKATGHSKVQFLLDYWTLGTEPTVESLNVGDPVAVGATIRSEIGKNALTVATVNAISIRTGPYAVYETADKKQHNNEFVVTPIPASDFQYSWINSAVSGSENWMNNQQLRGIAPKNGKLIVVGGGALSREIPAINFPSASSLYGE